MHKKIIASVFVLFAFAVGLCGCGQKDGKNIAPETLPQTEQETKSPEQTVVGDDFSGDAEPIPEADEDPPEEQPAVQSPAVSSNTVFDVVETDDGQPLGYKAPEGWYEPRYVTGRVINGGYDLTYDVMGLKVYEVEKYFGISPSTWGYYRDEVMSNVIWFQEENELIPTGDVDLATWLKFGFTEEDWYGLGTYVTPVAIKKGDDRDRIIEVFLETARTYLGTPFVVGASGEAGTGVDCSGLVLQCLYSIGIYPDGLDPVQHSTVEEYNSRLMWADPKFKEVQYDELLEGDLVFYRRPWSNTVCHVAIYVGGNECIEALYGDVEFLPLQKYDDNYEIMGYKRVISD